MEHLSYEDRLRELGNVHPEEEKAPERYYSGINTYSGPTTELEKGFLSGHVVIGQGMMTLICKRKDLDWIPEFFTSYKCGRALEQVAQRCYICAPSLELSKASLE
ncbi:hypothetical protein TURU_169192 [Turdus rufiventris]|nr:hypothetical protein TURU_169192 [Turdus rufiventris]